MSELLSSVTFDVIPCDSDTDLTALEAKIRDIAEEGLTWTASKQEPFAFGLQKLAMTCTIVDSLVSADLIQGKIEAMEDDVQSVEIANFVYNA